VCRLVAARDEQQGAREHPRARRAGAGRQH
jgi:hypothetical protein